MAKYLVIVESPAKVKTVKKFLGSNYEVAASNGHVRDLPKSQLGIDIENSLCRCPTDFSANPGHVRWKLPLHNCFQGTFLPSLPSQVTPQSLNI